MVSKICFGADPRGRAARITKEEEGWDGPVDKGGQGGAGKASRVGKVACAHCYRGSRRRERDGGMGIVGRTWDWAQNISAALGTRGG